MAFAYTAEVGDASGKGITVGTYTNTGGSTGGAIDTGLNTVLYFNSNNNTQSITTNQVAISGGTVTLTTVANEDGQWIAYGF